MKKIFDLIYKGIGENIKIYWIILILLVLGFTLVYVSDVIYRHKHNRKKQSWSISELLEEIKENKMDPRD